MSSETQSLVIRHRRTLMLVLVLLSMAARLATLKGNQWLLGEDVDDYLRLAANLSEWGTFGSYDDMPTAYRPPLYPILLAPLYWLQSHWGLAWGWRIAAIALMHLVFGAGATVLTFRLAQRLGLKYWSVLSGALVALDPLLLHHVRLPMTETLAAFLVAAALYLMVASDGRAGSWLTYAAGFVLGLGMLCRTTIWAFALVAAVSGGWLQRSDGRRNLEWASVVLVVALLVQVPWFLRNWFAFGNVILTTTHGGYTLLLGNNESYYDDVIRQAPLRAWSGDRLAEWQSEMNMRAALAGAKNEIARDAYSYQIARQTIAARPFDFAVAVLVRIVSFWRVVPHASEEYGTVVRLGCALFYVPEFLLMFAGLCQRRVLQWPFILCLAALVSFTVVHAVYWSDMRMRAPIMPAVALLAAVGAERVWSRYRRSIT